MKTEGLLEKDYEVARIMKALGNPVRLAILRNLIVKSRSAEQEGRCTCGDDCSCGDECVGAGCRCGCKCGEIVDLFSMSQSTVSQHIKELKNVGLINVNGRKGDYTFNHSKLSEGLISLLDLLGCKNEMIMENEKCKCGENCQCGENCNCGPDCGCKSGGECTCGPDCNCR